MQLKNYQKIAVDKLVRVSKKLLEKDDPRVCVFKAPTGSGKTIMIADFMEQLANERLPSAYVYLWISGNNLHKQSRGKLEQYLCDSRYAFSYLEDIQDSEFRENEVVFVNWHSLTKQDRKTGEYTNVFMRDNEGDKDLRSFIRNTKEKGLRIILIVDESHYHYWSPKSQELVLDVIGPKLTIEVSATPKLEPGPEDIANGDAGFVSIKFQEVVAEGMIKTEVIVNKEIGKHADFHEAADKVILAAALEKQKDLVRLYKKAGAQVHPLVLVQLPSESVDSTALDMTKLEFVEKFLKDIYDITIGNGLLGIWLSERKENIVDIANNQNGVKVLVFKQAIALGWDCPRAQILVMFRDIKSLTFEIQTVGRILRMPEIKHYADDELNRAFVYTNLGRIQIAGDKDSQSFFHINPAHHVLKYHKVALPSVYLSRVDFGDLTLRFRKIFIEEANKYFGITDKDSADAAKDKADVKLELLPAELTEPVISDAVLKGVDNVESVLGSVVHFTVPEDDLKYKFEFFAKACSLPYAPVRSHTKIQQALYDWFDGYLGYKDASRIEIQRIVVCSPNNQKIFEEIVESAKERFKEVDRKEKQSTQSRKNYGWDVPVIDYFNELYERSEARNYAMEPCYLFKDRSDPEHAFEADLAHNNKVVWWYKNGYGREDYFAIPYQDPISGSERSFYPDYIVLFKDGTIGIYDTKSGFTAESKETEAKSEALNKYVKALRSQGRKVVGEIIVYKKAGAFIYKHEDALVKDSKEGQRLIL